MKNKADLRRHIVMSVFSMTNNSGFSVELVAYVVGIREDTVLKILATCKDEYMTYVTGIYRKHKL